MANTTNTTYTFTGLNPETEYKVTVKAKDAAGNTSAGVSVDGSTGVTPVTYLYLDMNGATDYLKTPSITFDAIEMEFMAEQSLSTIQTYFDARTGLANGYMENNSNGSDSYNTTGWTEFVVDGVTKAASPINNTLIPRNLKTKVKFVLPAVGTDDVNIFSSSSNSNFVKGRLYDIKFYNGATVVAHYDMKTGTVQDQSGNGNHATLTGGTWVSSLESAVANISHLELNGIGGEYITTPALTFDSVELDIINKQPAGVNGYYIDARNGIAGGDIYRAGTDNTDKSGTAWSQIWVDGVQKTWNTAAIPNDQRATVKFVLNTVGTDNVNLFSNTSTAQTLKASVYGVKFFNGAELVAHYDMSTGTLVDQTGKGNDAILAGGTWTTATPIEYPATNSLTTVTSGLVHSYDFSSGSGTQSVLSDLTGTMDLSLSGFKFDATSGWTGAGLKSNNTGMLKPKDIGYLGVDNDSSVTFVVHTSTNFTTGTTKDSIYEFLHTGNEETGQHLGAVSYGNTPASIAGRMAIRSISSGTSFRHPQVYYRAVDTAPDPDVGIDQSIVRDDWNTAAETLVENTPVVITLTVDVPTMTASLYLNGTLHKSITVAHTPKIHGLWLNNDYITNHSFLVYNRALTQTEVQTVSNELLA